MTHNILLIGAFIFLSTIALSINNLILTTKKTIIGSEVQITGIGLAQALMDEITSCDFDENTTGNKQVRFTTELTSRSAFGTEGSESPYDDVDDYHNYTTTINTPRVDGYELSVQIFYANPFFPKYNWLFFKSYLKRVVITIKNQKYLHNPDSFSISSIVAYYK